MRSQIAVSARLGALVLAAVTLLAVVSTARSQEEVVLLVNGEPITSLDIQQRSKFMELSTHKAPTRQEAIDSLVDQILELREAKRYDIVPSDADVNNAYASVASHMGVDSQKLTQMLASGGASEATLKLQLKAQIAWTSLVRGRYKASLEIPDTDVEAELKLHQPDQKPSGLRVHDAPDHSRGSARRAADRLRRPQTRGRCFAGALRQLHRRHGLCASAAGSRSARSGAQILGRSAAATARYPRQYRSWPPDAARADRRGYPDVRHLLQERNRRPILRRRRNYATRCSRRNSASKPSATSPICAVRR